MKKVLVTGELHPIALELMKKEGLYLDVRPLLPHEQILGIIDQYHGLVTRSQTPVDKELIDAGTKLEVIGRAAIGIDNIDVDHATKQGLLVVNVPSDNVVSAAEHTYALMLATMRNLTRAGESLKNDQWERKPFQGWELQNKTLGIVGLGKVGGHVAQIARGFGMEVLAYDPYISKERFEKLRVGKKDGLKNLLQNSDIVTIHTPRTSETLGMLDYLTLKEMRSGAVLINCARGGIADEDAILRLLDEKHILRAGIDVFDKEPVIDHPLHKHPNCVCTPHLGASTVEAQERVGKTIALQIAKALTGRVVDHPVNMPLVEDELFKFSRGYCSTIEKIGRLSRQLITFNPSFLRMHVCGKDLAEAMDLLKAAFFKGYFQDTSEQTVNYINSLKIAEQRGLSLEAIKDPLHDSYSHLIRVEIYGDGEPVTVSGTMFGDKSRIVELNSYPMDIGPEGIMLLIRNQDRPGVIAGVAGLLGAADVNIARWELGRKEEGGQALGLVKLDQKVPNEVLSKISDLEHIVQVRQIDLGELST